MEIGNDTFQKGECVKIYEDYVAINPHMIKDRMKDKVSPEDEEYGYSAVLDSISINDVRTRLCSQCSATECTAMHKSKLRTKPRGSETADVVFVNKIPSLFDTASGVSLGDEKGILLNIILKKMKDMGICNSSIYYTDLVKCCINEEFTTNEIAECVKQYIMTEMVTIRPKIIIGNGLSVLRAMNAFGIIYSLPDQITYGTVYNVSLPNNHNTKIIGVYEIEKVIAKTGDDLLNCKNQLWQQLVTAFNAIKEG